MLHSCSTCESCGNSHQTHTQQMPKTSFLQELLHEAFTATVCDFEFPLNVTK